MSQLKWIDPQAEESRKRFLGSIGEFYHAIRPVLSRITNEDTFKSLNNDWTIDSMGYEGGMESIIRLFEKGHLKMYSLDEYNFIVVYQRGDKRTCLYDTEVNRVS